MKLIPVYLWLSWFCLGGLIRAQVTLSVIPSRELGHPSASFNPLQPFLLSNFNANLVEGRELATPSGVALDTGVSPPILYIADTGNNRVLGWNYTASLGVPSSDSSYRFPPADIVIGQNDRFSTTPQSAQVNANGLAGPSGLAVDPNGNLYVADSRNNRVLRFARGSKFPDMVIGQASFNSNSVNQGQGQNSPSANTIFLGNASVALAFDRSSPPNLYLADAGNNRVLRYAASDLAAGLNGPSANLVLGQSDFNTATAPPQPFDASNVSVMDRLRSPTGLAFDAQNRLYVSDTFNRVLVFPANITNNGRAAQFIAGIPPRTNPAPSPDTVGRSTLGAPHGLFVTSDGRVGVVDQGYSRILLFDPVDRWPSFASPTPSPTATGILGQPGYIVASNEITRYINGANGSATPVAEPASNTFSAPYAALLSGNELFVVDTFNHRVLVMPQQGTSFGPATRVIGQDQFNYNSINLIEGREFQFVVPVGNGTGVADAAMIVDQTSNPPHLYVADTYNNRVLGFLDARTVRPGATADLVLGQPDMFHSECNYPRNDPNQANASSLCQPAGLTLDSRGNLWVADTVNHRVLRFPTPFVQRTNLQTADQVIGQPNFTSNSRSFASFGLPYGVALDSDIRMAISDQAFNRVLIYELQGSTWNRTKVLGQPDPNNCPGTTCPFGNALNQMRTPSGVAMDSSGNLYVADAQNNRVLIFGNIVQLSNGDSAQSYSLTGLSGPQNVFVNQQTGEIWVTNTGSNNVLRYPQLDSIVKGSNQPLSIQEASFTLAVAQDQFGDLYVADSSNRIVVHYPALVPVNGAHFLLAPNFQPLPLAPGMIASICPALHIGSTGACAADDPHQFGEDSATFNDLPNPVPLPTTLADTQVLLNGTPVPLMAVTPRQINFQVPMSTPLGTSVLEVLRPSTGQTIGTSTVTVAATSPGLFHTETRTTAVFSGGPDPCRGPLGICFQALATNDDGSANSPSNPILHGKTITLYGTGQGVVPNAPPDGELTPPAEIRTSQTPRLFLGASDQTSNITFSGLAPGLVGVWQINLKIADLFQAVTGGASSSYIVVIQTADLKVSNDANRLQVTIAVK
jgi:uncharacterized protein (TIGR03437 family)